jgi:hypothetical protein
MTGAGFLGRAGSTGALRDLGAHTPPSNLRDKTMRGHTFSSTSRRAMAAGVALLATMSAACSDTVTEPEPVDIPAAASRIQIQPVLVKTATLNVIDVGGSLLTENAIVKFWTSPTDSVVLIDNAPQDLDPTVGKVKVLLVNSAAYKACSWGWTVNYMAEKNPVTYPTCSNGVIRGNAVAFGSVYMRRKPRIAFYTQAKNGSVLSGASVKMTPPNGFVPYTVADGGASPLDYDNTVNGVIQFKSSAGAGVHSWCEVIAPVGYALANPSCGTLDAKFEGEYAIVLKHKAL